MSLLPRTRTTRRARTIAAAAGLLAVVALAAPSAAAGPAAGTPAVPVAGLAPAAAPAPAPVRAAGRGQLAAASDALAAADVAGSAWYADAASGRLVVTADSRVDARGIARIEQAAKGLRGAGALVINRVPGVFRPLIAGGQPIYAPGFRCTLGFNARDSGGRYYALVAGHCVTQATTWYIDPGLTQILGTVTAASFPGDDFAIIKYANPANADGRVYLYNGAYQDITQAGNAYVGQAVKRSGYVTGVHSGTVTAVNVTVNYGGGNVVYGLVQTNVCAEPGDSGGPFFAGTTALGLTSGASGNCSTGGTTFFQPVTEPLSAYQLSVF